MVIRKRFWGLLGLIFFGLIIGCEENGPENEEELLKSGKIVFKITDAPFPSELVAEANITVDWVSLKADSLNVDIDEDDEMENPDFYFIELAEDSSFNLLELSNGITALLGEVVVPAGHYKEIRMHIKDAEVILTDGSVYDLKIPSSNASGLKIKINPSLFLNEGEIVELLLDVDVSRSFIVRGNLNHPKGKNNVKGFIFKPVIRAVPQFVSGQISGVVSDTSNVVLENAFLALLDNEDTVTTALTSAEGFYSIIGIPAGNYSLSCNKEGYIQNISDNIEIKAGDFIEENFNLIPEDSQ